MFIKRLISSMILMVVATGVLLLGGPVLVAMLYATSCVALIELTRTLKVQEHGKPLNHLEIVGLIGMTGYYIVAYLYGFHMGLMLPMIALILLLMVVYVVLFPKYHISQIVATYFAVFYAPVMLSFVYFLREFEEGIILVWLIVVASWVCDTGAYVTGMLFGKHQLAPTLSPKKTIEGAIGGVMSATLVGIFASNFVEESVFLIGAICAVGSILAQIGDLSASAIKRNYNIKDYGNLIPGHGGIMDRFDSMIFIAPLIYFILMIC